MAGRASFPSVGATLLLLTTSGVTARSLSRGISRMPSPGRSAGLKPFRARFSRGMRRPLWQGCFKGPLSATGGLKNKVSSNEEIEERTMKATALIGSMYEKVVEGMRDLGMFRSPDQDFNNQAKALMEALQEGKALDEIGVTKSGNQGLDEVIFKLVRDNIDEMDEYFLAVLNTYIYQIRQTTVDQTMSIILSLIREEILIQVTRRLPSHMQVIQRLSESSDDIEWATIIGKALGMDADLISLAEGWRNETKEAYQEMDDLAIDDIEKEVTKQASLKQLVDMDRSKGPEGDSMTEMIVRLKDEMEIPRCTAEQLILGVSQIIDDLEEVTVIPDFRFLVKLVLIREKILDLDAAVGLADSSRPSLAHLLGETRGSFPEKVSSYIAMLTQLADEIETQRIIYLTFREQDQASSSLKNDKTQESKIQEIRPGEFMASLTASMTKLSETIGGNTNMQVIEYLSEATRRRKFEEEEESSLEGGPEREKAALMLSKLQSIRMDALTVLRTIMHKTETSPGEFYNAKLNPNYFEPES
ncbi:hypothetical protein AAMO2058_000411900 [Amorphochlora amoebiformis]